MWTAQGEAAANAPAPTLADMAAQANSGGITVEQYQALKAQLDAARQALRAQEEAAAAAAAAATEETAVCSISFEECPVSQG